MRPKTVARNEVESGYKKSTAISQSHVISPQGKIKISNEVESGYKKSTAISQSHVISPQGKIKIS